MSFIEIVCDDNGGYIKVKLDRKLILKRVLEINIGTIIDRIAASRLVKVKHEHIQAVDRSTMKLSPVSDPKKPVNRMHALRQLAADLPDVIISGLPMIKYSALWVWPA